MGTLVGIIIGAILALVGTIAIMIVVFPTSKDGYLSPILQKIHDNIHFKNLVIEKILKFFYILSTLTAVLCGVLSFNIIGFMVAIIAPFFIRITYEGSIMFILGVQAVLNINQRLTDTAVGEDGYTPKPKAAPAPKVPPAPQAAPAPKAAPAPQAAPAPKAPTCNSCQSPLAPGVKFCAKCGTPSED